MVSSNMPESTSFTVAAYQLTSFDQRKHMYLIKNLIWRISHFVACMKGYEIHGRYLFFACLEGSQIANEGHTRHYTPIVDGKVIFRRRDE